MVRKVMVIGWVLGALWLAGPDGAGHPVALANEGCQNHHGDDCGGGQIAGGGDETLTRLWLEGFVDVPGPSLDLPLGPADPAVVLILTFGVPAVQVPITVTPDTRVRDESGQETPVQLVDGDRVQLGVQVIGDVLWARRLQVEEFPELKLQGVARSVPGGALALPLPAGTSVEIQVALGGSTLTLPVHITAQTRLEPGTLTLHEDDRIQVKAVVDNFQIVAVKLEREEE